MPLREIQIPKFGFLLQRRSGSMRWSLPFALGNGSHTTGGNRHSSPNSGVLNGSLWRPRRNLLTQSSVFRRASAFTSSTGQVDSQGNKKELISKKSAQEESSSAPSEDSDPILETRQGQSSSTDIKGEGKLLLCRDIPFSKRGHMKKHVSHTLHKSNPVSQYLAASDPLCTRLPSHPHADSSSLVHGFWSAPATPSLSGNKAEVRKTNTHTHWDQWGVWNAKRLKPSAAVYRLGKHKCM